MVTGGNVALTKGVCRGDGALFVRGAEADGRADALEVRGVDACKAKADAMEVIVAEGSEGAGVGAVLLKDGRPVGEPAGGGRDS